MSSSSSSRRRSVSSSRSSVSSSDSATKVVYNGFTVYGERFVVPETLNTVQTLIPTNWSITSVIVLSILSFATISTFFAGWSKWPHIAIFFFFRVAYNLGLGLILRAQSERRSFEKFYGSLLKRFGGKDSRHFVCRLFRHLAQTQLADKSVDVNTLPESFRAWLVYKNLVNIILINDGITYLLLCIKCFHAPPDFSPIVLAQYGVGVFLWVFNYWAKLDAHRAIGEMAWFWGDFYFRKDEKLTFDGIFELFPHPMYTVGYSGYYGCSLLTRSYTMLFVSLIAHAMQIAFLFFVEEPHIERTYGRPQPVNNEVNRILYDPSTGLFPNKQDPIFVLNLRWHRAADVALIVLLAYSILFSFAVSDRSPLIFQVLFWRFVHWFGLGALLWSQSRLQFWTRLYERHGRTLFEAFSNWKSLYNLSVTINWAVFICAAIRYAEAEWHWDNFAKPAFVASLVLGSILIFLSLWSSYSTYKCVGEFGWFYGDFFINDATFKQDLCYTGIYRFLNNPDCWAGYAGQYGLALISQSWTIAGLALMSQIMNFGFLNLVELPHMQKLYDNADLRRKAPIEGAIERVAKEVGQEVSQILPESVREVAAAQADKIESEIKKEITKIRVKALSEMYEMYGKLKARREQRRRESEVQAATKGKKGKSNKEENLVITHQERQIIGKPLEIELSADPSSPSDWIGIYPVDMPSKPGSSDGKWMYLTEGAGRKLVFPPSRLPSREGIYEVRYHSNNQYQVIATSLICLIEDENASPRASFNAADSAPNSPALSPRKPSKKRD